MMSFFYLVKLFKTNFVVGVRKPG